MGESDVEPAAARERTEGAEASGHGACLSPRAGAPVARADDFVRNPVQLEELERLRVVARRDLDGVPAVLQERDQRAEEEDLWRVRDVDPDAHPVDLSDDLDDK